MSDVSMEQKLQLVQQVRSRYHENQYDLYNRERIIYGKTTLPSEKPGYSAYPAYGDTYGEMLPPGERPVSFFKLRLFIAVFLLAAVVIMDKNDMKIAGISTDTIFQMISDDYEEKIEEWVEALSQ